MTTTPLPVYAQAINTGVIVINNGTAQSYVTGLTAGTNGTIVTGISVTSTDTSARDVTINITRSATNYQVTQVSIPITAGTLNSAPTIGILTSSQIAGLPIDGNGNPMIYLMSGDTLTFNAPVTVTSGKQITFFVTGKNL